jgi:ribonucleotide reductase beta subunit family protein with ferritin-like domain
MLILIAFVEEISGSFVEMNLHGRTQKTIENQNDAIHFIFNEELCHHSLFSFIIRILSSE